MIANIILLALGLLVASGGAMERAAEKVDRISRSEEQT